MTSRVSVKQHAASQRNVDTGVSITQAGVNVTKSYLYYYIIIYPFECETYTNTCLQCNRVQYREFNPYSVKYYYFSNIDCSTVGDTVFIVVQSAKQSSSDLLPI